MSEHEFKVGDWVEWMEVDESYPDFGVVRKLCTGRQYSVVFWLRDMQEHSTDLRRCRLVPSDVAAKLDKPSAEIDV